MQWTVAEKPFSEQDFSVVFQFTFKKNFQFSFESMLLVYF